MKKNIGLMDRAIRIAIAALIVYLYTYNFIEGTLGAMLIVGAVILVLTSLISFCPLYLSLGINTFKGKKEN
ncbi:MAG: DUF2892 domain-containing protein [Bacteroidia bacterium]|jgi:hypothetical protein|nr:DUF2892 domain-containing protein [Bacteroidia bacterium]